MKQTMKKSMKNTTRTSKTSIKTKELAITPAEHRARRDREAPERETTEVRVATKHTEPKTHR